MSISQKLREHVAAKRVAVQRSLDADKSRLAAPVLQVEVEWLDFIEECAKAIEDDVYSEELSQRLKDHVEVTANAVSAAMKAAEGTFKEQLLKADALWLKVLDEASGLLLRTPEAKPEVASVEVVEEPVAEVVEEPVAEEPVAEVVEEAEKKPKPRATRAKAAKIEEPAKTEEKEAPKPRRRKKADEEDNS